MSKTTRTVVRWVSIAVAVILLILCVVRIGLFYSSYSNGMDAANDAIADLRVDLQKQDAILDEEYADISAREALIHSAYASGSGVANLQNSYASGDSEASEIRSSMERYFSGNDCGQWVVWNPSMYPISWSCLTDYSFEEDSVKVLWTLSGGSGTVYAYAVADYSATGGKFTNLKIVMTSAGAGL